MLRYPRNWTKWIGETFSNNISNFASNDKDAPWMTCKMTTAIILMKRLQ